MSSRSLSHTVSHTHDHLYVRGVSHTHTHTGDCNTLHQSLTHIHIQVIIEACLAMQKAACRVLMAPVCCSVLQRVVVCCSVLQCIAVYCSVLQGVAQC